LSQFRSDRAIALPRPITLAILPYGNNLAGLVARARTAGHEVMLHLPMEPRALDADPGPNALLTGLPEGELDRRIAVNLGRLNGYVGVNNHMGSRFTASARDMRRVMVALRARDLLFLDSLTTGRSTGHGLAREFGIPTVVRDIFLDNDRAPASIRRQLARTVARARGHGHAIAIGHPYPGNFGCPGKLAAPPGPPGPGPGPGVGAGLIPCARQKCWFSRTAGRGWQESPLENWPGAIPARNPLTKC
jgi:hypothetical protein